MFDEYMADAGVEEIAAKYELEIATVRQVLCSERIRRAVNPNRTCRDIYRAASILRVANNRSVPVNEIAHDEAPSATSGGGYIQHHGR